MSSKGLIVNGKMAHHAMEGAILFAFSSLRFCESSRLGHLTRLVFYSIKHIVDGNLEWNKVGLFITVLVLLVRLSGWCMNDGGFVIWILPWGNYYYAFSVSGSYLGGDWSHTESPF